MKAKNIQSFLNIKIHCQKVDFEVLQTQNEARFDRHLIQYLGNEKDEIRAYLFIPRNIPIIGSVLVHHQHNSERHLGKSEVAGITGDPLQFFCPELAKKGVITLAPDSICFEDRRSNKRGYEPDDDPDNDVLQHYNEMCYRLLKGTTLMKKVVEDSSIGISLLAQFEQSNPDKIGILGHSYGGNTVIFHSPFDERIRYSCSSGAVCSYKTKFEDGTGIEMAEVIPGFATQYDIDDLLKLVCPRELFILSATEDKFSQDAEMIFQKVQREYKKEDKEEAIVHKRFVGEHALDKERFNLIIQWFIKNFEGIK